MKLFPAIRSRVGIIHKYPNATENREVLKATKFTPYFIVEVHSGGSGLDFWVGIHYFDPMSCSYCAWGLLTLEIEEKMGQTGGPGTRFSYSERSTPSMYLAAVAMLKERPVFR